MTPTPSTSAGADWSPFAYLRFEAERTRPARDLLAQVPLDDPAKIVDVGCGPGNSTELLAARYPKAGIVGLDTSAAMLAQARERLPGNRFETADAGAWVPGSDVDLVFSNATYQWVPDHLPQLQRVTAALRPGAVLAVQMPDNLAEPTHRLMREVAAGGPWADRLRTAARAPLPPATTYFDGLAPLAARVDIWRTRYFHPLADAAAIVAFVRSTGLRPFLEPLSADEQKDFLARYTEEITHAYPAGPGGGVLLPFPRLFFVVQR